MKVVFSVAIACALSLVSWTAFAGTYLNIASMFTRESLDAGEWVRTNLGDQQLLRTAHRMAEARVDAVRALTVPHEVEKAHPHFLLSLVSMERAIDAAIRGQSSAFVRYLDSARGEVRTFRTILDQLGFSLPDAKTAPIKTPHSSMHSLAPLAPTTSNDRLMEGATRRQSLSGYGH